MDGCFSAFRKWYSARWPITVLMVVSLSIVGCEEDAPPSMRNAGIARLANHYFNALDTGNIEEYRNLFQPSGRPRMDPILTKTGNLEIADWAALKTKYGWLFADEDRKLDVEIYPLRSGAPTADLVLSFQPEVKVWKIAFCYYHGSRMRERRSHLLVSKEERFFLYLPPDMEARVQNRLSDLRAFCAEIQEKADSFRQSMDAAFSAAVPQHTKEMQHIRYPLYVESIGSGNYGCILSLGAPEVLIHSSVSIGTEILIDMNSIAEQLLLADAIEKDEKLESPAAFSNRTGFSPLFSHLGKGVTLNASYQYASLVFTKMLTCESPSVVLIRALDLSEPRATKAKAFMSTIEAVVKELTMHSAVRYRLDARRVGIYASQTGKPKDAFELDLRAELIDVNDLSVRRNASFHAFPPGVQSLTTGYRSSYDMVYDDFRDWLVSLH